jgi:hypothetical protein
MTSSGSENKKNVPNLTWVHIENDIFIENPWKKFGTIFCEAYFFFYKYCFIFVQNNMDLEVYKQWGLGLKIKLEWLEKMQKMLTSKDVPINMFLANFLSLIPAYMTSCSAKIYKKKCNSAIFATSCEFDYIRGLFYPPPPQYISQPSEFLRKV